MNRKFKNESRKIAARTAIFQEGFLRSKEFFKPIIIKKGVEVWKKYWCDWLKKQTQSKNFVYIENTETICKTSWETYGLNCKVAYVPKYVLRCCLKATAEFVILDYWTVLVKALTQTFPDKNYEHEHQFRWIIYHKPSVQSNIRRKGGHVYKSQVVAFDAKKHSSKYHSKERLRKHKI